MVEEGNINLDENVSSYIPEIEVPYTVLGSTDSASSITWY